MSQLCECRTMFYLRSVSGMLLFSGIVDMSWPKLLQHYPFCSYFYFTHCLEQGANDYHMVQLMLLPTSHLLPH